MRSMEKARSDHASSFARASNDASIRTDQPLPMMVRQSQPIVQGQSETGGPSLSVSFFCFDDRQSCQEQQHWRFVFRYILWGIETDPKRSKEDEITVRIKRRQIRGMDPRSPLLKKVYSASNDFENNSLRFVNDVLLNLPMPHLRTIQQKLSQKDSSSSYRENLDARCDLRKSAKTEPHPWGQKRHAEIKVVKNRWSAGLRGYGVARTSWVLLTADHGPSPTALTDLVRLTSYIHNLGCLIVRIPGKIQDSKSFRNQRTRCLVGNRCFVAAP